MLQLKYICRKYLHSNCLLKLVMSGTFFGFKCLSVVLPLRSMELNENTTVDLKSLKKNLLSRESEYYLTFYLNKKLRNVTKSH